MPVWAKHGLWTPPPFIDLTTDDEEDGGGDFSFFPFLLPV
jgi:hypothetical protein